jgi:hypothetical protein
MKQDDGLTLLVAPCRVAKRSSIAQANRFIPSPHCHESPPYDGRVVQACSSSWPSARTGVTRVSRASLRLYLRLACSPFFCDFAERGRRRNERFDLQWARRPRRGRRTRSAALRGERRIRARRVAAPRSDSAWRLGWPQNRSCSSSDDTSKASSGASFSRGRSRRSRRSRRRKPRRSSASAGGRCLTRCRYHRACHGRARRAALHACSTSCHPKPAPPCQFGASGSHGRGACPSCHAQMK